ncbi:MAG: class I SAM-dependent methyltransferase [Anaeroplasmataceae bacterium]|nr:class I SAM-dependent methyltransferase [Anaeroplasmataceae bacterium]MDE6415275.1 class I SAM-dependent methyltransferase [Anaeroplasmataceae bacterium]MDE7213348.1 class I SAM-dependent methyltransferase [Anaeroplasmataceae bacterium]
MGKKYYEAYDDRYKQIHKLDLQWSSETPSKIVFETLQSFSLLTNSKILEIGCGEGRDAYLLLKQGFDVLATDVSYEAVSYCKKKFPNFSEHFQVVDCVTEKLGKKFDFIYAVAVIHMLVSDNDRIAFYRFIREHLSSNGIALICTMGDGSFERKTDIHTAFDIMERVHGETGKTVQIANTSCRIVGFATFEEEISRNGLEIIKKGITAVEPDFPQMMFAVVKSKR